jgi:hypothetical protein
MSLIGSTVLPCALFLALVAVVCMSGPALAEIVCEGTHCKHLQGIAMDNAAIYWCFTRRLVKTDVAGNVLKVVTVRSHHGDLTWHDGKVYVAVNFGAFNQEPGKADSWVYVYRAEDLSFISRHPLPQLVHGAGGMAYHKGRFVVVGGLPETHKENYIYEYDENFTFLKRHDLPSGYTRLGIQTACYAHGFWWFGCYGKKLLKADESFRLIGKYDRDCSVGIVGVSENRFLIGRCFDDSKRGKAFFARPDPVKGVVRVEAGKHQK